jgi:hypothetical protein
MGPWADLALRAGRDSHENLRFCRDFIYGARGTRTPDLLGAIQALSQLSYSPTHRKARSTKSVVGASIACAGDCGAVKLCVVGRWRRFPARSAARGAQLSDTQKNTADRRGMVWKAMGLLDDAIREHLEFKRRRGADPNEVARQEGEVFGPARHEREVGQAGDPANAAGGRADALEGVGAFSGSSLSRIGQETVELDMRAVFAAESIERPGPSEPDLSALEVRAARSRAPEESPAGGDATSGDFLGWELPEERDFSGRLREKESQRGVLDAHG